MRDSVVELAHQTGTPDDKIYIYDGSKQSDRYTANVSGLFGTARVAMSAAERDSGLSGQSANLIPPLR